MLIVFLYYIMLFCLIVILLFGRTKIDVLTFKIFFIDFILLIHYL